ncbi:MAG: right-handed parallel beta-helix repeat-containing protein [Planctomycetes bacterium]|nr:right-handed parallel beta-helix repeat-containing protein [Planctomycetota bacterium]
MTTCTPVLRGILLGTLALSATAAELTVGPGKTYAKPSLAAAAANHGDTISIDAGTYLNDVCTWTKDNLTIRGVGGYAVLSVPGFTIPNGKAIWVIAGANTTIEGIRFTDAKVPDENGAGIRQEGAGLTVRGCQFHQNENGILSGANPASDILIEGCEFSSSGNNGYAHNVYIGTVRSLTFRGNYSHHTKVGHNLKSRAQSNHIIANRLMDEATGTASYAIDLPNGGLSFISGNCIQQGPASSNHSRIVVYGAEGLTNPVSRLYVCSNTIVNDHPSTTTVFLYINPAATLARVENNLFLGPGTAIGGLTTAAALHNLATTTDPLLGRAAYDYHLKTGAAAIDAGADPGSADGQALLPARQYLHPASSEPRTTSGAAPDIGAYEAAGAVPPEMPVATGAAVAVPLPPAASLPALPAGGGGGGGRCGLGGLGLVLSGLVLLHVRRR